VGVLIGAVAGYFGGRVDWAVMRFTDLFMTIPVLFLVLILVAAYGTSLVNTIVVLGLVYWPGVARLVRGQVLALRARDFVHAARALGAEEGRILVRHLLPNASGVVIVQVTLAIATAILAESALSFLGLGVPKPTPSWGNMLTEGRLHLTGAWWIATFPGAAIFVSVLAFNLAGDGLRDALDPHLR
jgi:peptide/nickel transport system permease protein